MFSLLYKSANSSGPADCQRLCDSNKACEVWSFQEGSEPSQSEVNECMLKGNISRDCDQINIGGSPGFWSGVKTPTTQCCWNYRQVWSADFTLWSQDTLDLRVLVDRSVVEIFVAGGRVAALRVQDEQHPRQEHGVHLRVRGVLIVLIIVVVLPASSVGKRLLLGRRCFSISFIRCCFAGS